MTPTAMDARELEGIDVGSLGSLAVGESVCRPLQYDRAEYVDFQEFIAGIDNIPARKIRVKKSALSVNGRVVADKMPAYLAAKCESSGALKQVLVTPRHYQIYKDPRIERTGAHFELGTFCHSAFLEPKLFERVRIEPKASEASISGLQELIRWYWEQLGVADECILSDLGRDPLKDVLAGLRERFAAEGFTRIQEEHKAIIDIIRAGFKTYGGGILPKILKYADAETSFYGTDPSTGLDVKVRPDAVLLEENVGANIIVSFKTTRHDTIEGFARDAVRLGYDLSEGMYLDVASHVTDRQFSGTLMVVLQTVQPWQVFALWWNPEDLVSGKYKYRQAIDIIAECKEKRYFPGYDARAEEGAHGIIKFELPAYSRIALPEQVIDDTQVSE